METAMYDRVKKTFLELVRIPSPSRRERKVADYLKKRLKRLGLRVTEDRAGRTFGGNAGNIIAVAPATVRGAQAVTLMAHMDTVVPADKISPLVRGYIVKTDGTSVLGGDDKAGITAILEGVRSVLGKGAAHGKITLIFTVGEEIGLCGAYALDAKHYRDTFVYAFDHGGPLGEVIIRSAYIGGIKVECIGKSAHSAADSSNSGVNAIAIAAKGLTGFKIGRISSDTTCNFGRIEGGLRTNIVPEKVTLDGEVRSLDIEKLKKCRLRIKNSFEKAADSIGGRIKWRQSKPIKGVVTKRSDPIVRLAREAFKRIGIKLTPIHSMGGYDGNAIVGSRNPVVNVALGGGGGHSVAEWHDLRDIENGARFVRELVLAAGA